MASYEVSYQEIYDLWVYKWRTEGAEPATKYLEDMLAGTTGELRGMVYGMLGESCACQATPEKLSNAVSYYRDALDLIITPAYRFQTIVCTVGVCVDAHITRMGDRYCLEAEKMLRDGVQVTPRWMAVYHLNSGRVSLQMKDLDDALTSFCESERNFRATPLIDGVPEREQEALMAMVFQAEVRMWKHQYDEAMEICKTVRESATSTSVINHLNIVQAKIAIRMGNVDMANRLAMRATEMLCGKLGGQDSRLFVGLISLMADIVAWEHPAMANDILQFLVSKLSASAKVDLSEIVGRLKE